MGVPSFYRWLSRKYPKIVLDVVEEKLPEIDGKRPPVDASLPNPNGFEIDNLYLDMNGIIHPCCHPEDGEQPDSEEDMIARVFLYIDRIFAMVRPRKVLYMGIDGVAPRAKMNQQRSRRFRAAKDVTDAAEVEDALRQEWIDKGMVPPPKKRRPWDSNVITPGTPFMAKLSTALHWYILDRVSHDKGWRGIKVIFSDAKVPGEGEHKIMQFIRRQRAAPGYDPNTRHCLYGMDADLIMLGLATHEPHTLIFRETITEPMRNNAPRCFLCGQTGHRANDCSGIIEEEKQKADSKPKEVHEELGLMEKPFQFLLLNVLREYLAHDLYVPNLPFAWDLEHVIDDFVFLCFFVGNDFLPHLPALEIREGAIERLTAIYKRLLPSMGGYIASEGGQLNLSRVDILLSDLGIVEDSIFKSRKGKEDFMKQRDANRSAQLSSRRAQTLKARESSYALAEQEGFSAAKGGVNVHAKPLSAAERVAQNKEKNAPQAGLVPEIKEAAPLPHAGTKRKTKTEDEPTAGTPVKKEGSAKKKKKLSSGAAVVTDDEDDEDPKDGAFRPTSHNDSSDSSDSDSDASMSDDDDESFSSESGSEYDEEEDAKSKKRKAKQKAKKKKAAAAAAAAKKAKSEPGAGASAAAAASAPKVKVKKEGPVDNLLQSSTAAAAKVLDAEAEKLDFGALLNAKLQAMTRSLAGVEEDAADPNAPPRDPVRFGEDGWKERYYAAKLHIERTKSDDSVVFHKLFKSYAEGLAWVMAYYYSGCASWSWYYPFHYAPMASDLINLDRYAIEFDKGEPFKPVGQLMGVLPALSAHAVPQACQELMVNPLSPIIDFYPSDFPLDLNGAKALWRAVALLPWIEEKRLLTELAKVEPTFTPEEKHRNSLGVDYLFVHKSHLLANSLYALTLSHPAESLAGKSDAELAAEGSKYRMAIDTLESGGMSGYLVPWPGAPEIGSTVESQIGLDPVEDVQALCAIYVDPPHRPHQCALLPGLVPPAPVLVKEDLTEENRGGGGQQGGGGPNGNYNSRNNRQRDSQQGGGRGGYAGNMSTHGGQGPAAQPRFGDAASHFQQNATGNRIWSSGYNQRGGGPDQQQGGRGGAAAGGGGRGGYQGGYGQQQQGGYGNSGYAARGGGFQHQRGGYGGGGRGGYNSPPAQRQYQQQYSPQQYQDQQQQYSPQPPPPSGYSHSRNSGPPAAAAAASNNPFAALAAQAAQALNAHRAMQQQQRRPQ